MNCDNLKALVVEIDNAKDKCVIVNLTHRPPNESIKRFHEYVKLFLDRATISNKNIVLIGDFDLNLPGFYHSHYAKIYVNQLFKTNLLILINKPTRVTNNLFLLQMRVLSLLLLRQTYPIPLLFLRLVDSQKVLLKREYTRNVHITYKKIFSETQIQIKQLKLKLLKWAKL